MHSATVARLNWPAGLPPKSLKISIRQGQHRSGARMNAKAAVDQNRADYIEFYRFHAQALNHCGMRIENFPNHLNQIEVIIDHKQ